MLLTFFVFVECDLSAVKASLLLAKALAEWAKLFLGHFKLVKEVR
jgi:hypothetical protein